MVVVLRVMVLIVSSGDHERFTSLNLCRVEYQATMELPVLSSGMLFVHDECSWFGTTVHGCGGA